MKCMFKRWPRITLILWGVAICGCAEFQSGSLPAEDRAARIPGANAAMVKPVDPANLKGALTLACAVETALAHNPGLSARRHEISVADAEHGIARSALLPKMDLVGSYAHYRDDRMITPRRRGDASVLQFTDQELAGDVVVRMPLFTGGRLIHEVKAARLLRTAAQHNLARNREELIFNVTSVFYSILAQRHTIEALKYSRATLEEHHKRVEELLEVKKAARVDLLRTEVRLSDLERREAQESNVLAIQNRILANLMGAPSLCSASNEARGSLELIETSVPDMRASLNQALTQRGDYRAAKIALDAHRRKTAAARALRWPTVDLLGSYGTRVDAHDTSEDNEVGSVMVGVNIPVFSGGYISAMIKKEDAAQAAAAERLHQLELQLQLDIETSILNIESSRKRVRATEKSIDQAKESLRIERERYEFGKGSIIDVLEAQSALLNAQMNYYNSLAAHKTAQAQHALAIGEIQ